MKYTLESSREWYNNLPGKRTSAAVIVRYDGKILMVKDDYKSAMTFPGGVIDPDESAKTAAIRETREEVGLDLDPAQVEFHSVAYVPKKNGFNDRFQFFFLADIDAETAALVSPESGIEYYAWVEPFEVGTRAGGRGTYVELATMLSSGLSVPYFEV